MRAFLLLFVQTWRAAGAVHTEYVLQCVALCLENVRRYSDAALTDLPRDRKVRRVRCETGSTINRLRFVIANVFRN